MEWSMPDRPRRVVTYGRSTQKRNQQPQTSQVQREPDNNGSTSTRRSNLGSPISSEHGSTQSIRNTIEQNAPAWRKSLSQDSYSVGQSSKSNTRSPKRRKLSPIDDDGRDSPTDSPRAGSRVGGNTQTTYARKTPLRRSISDIPSTSPTYKRSDVRLSLSPDRSYKQSLTSNNHPASSTDIDSSPYIGITPSRRRLVDSLGALDEQADTSQSEVDSPRQKSVSAKSKDSTPLPNDNRDLHHHDDSTELKPRHKTHEIVEKVTSPQSGSPKVTYARQRSFLRSIDLDGHPSGDATTDPSTNLFSVPLQPAPIDHAEAEQTENLGTISSIHELRRAGVNARFQGLVDSIFEDIEDRSLSTSVRQSGLIQLCEKLLDDNFAQRFVEIGAFERLTGCMEMGIGLIAALLSVYACALVLRLNHLPTITYTSAWPQLIALAPMLLALDDSIPKLVSQRRFSLNRINQASIRDIHLQASSRLSLDEQESVKLSPRRLLLRSLSSTLRKVREKDVAEAISAKVISQLVDVLLELAQQATDHNSVPPEDIIVLESIISILETYTTSSNITGKAQQDALLPLTKSSHLLLSLSKQSDPQDTQLLTLQLRLILNITNASSSLCEHFATAELIHGLTAIVLSNYHTASDNFIDEKRDSLDIVILALGALINLTEVSETARQNVLGQKEDSRTLLEQLTSIFTRGLDSVSEADSVVQTHSNVAFGYLSILLCTLCLEREAYSLVKSAMNGTGLVRLLATVEEFLHYHRKVDEELHQSQSVKEFTVRLQGILDQVRAISM